MSETTVSGMGVPDHPITLGDIRHKALRIRDEVKDEYVEQVVSRRNRLMVAGAVAVLVVVGVAYFAGTMAGRRVAEPPRS
jgi:hypothetical protein